MHNSLLSSWKMESQNEPSKLLLAVISADLSFLEMAEMRAGEGDPRQ